MYTLYKNEWLKLRRQFLWVIILFVPIAGVLLGTFSYVDSYDLLVDGENEWYAFWTQITFFYGLFIFPILAGIYAAFICRSEHQNGGWKHLLSLPVSRFQLFFAKLFTLYTLLFLTQVILFVTAILIGMQVNESTNIPLSFLVGATAFGWIATFPLAMIQLWMSINTRSFAIALGINITFVLGSLVTMIVGIEQFYPWAHPSIAMGSPEEVNISKNGIFNIITLYFIILSSFFIFKFQRKEI
ncbi:ABC transporter permease [Halalkalibacterium halodurans]|uniref:ABC transporter permease n=1 Tax=Halalkalibacterium halodurans TaxID=86665 RepID=UPI002E1F9F95|nr:ABC transporter permease [Halalkalibacterium halodurans]